MNIIFCTSPFQVLVAREIAKATGEKFFGIYLKMSHDSRQKIYAEKMSEFCEDFLFIEDKHWPEKLINKLENIKIEKFYLASLDNPVALSIFNYNSMHLFTFDDGSTSVISPNMYTEYTDRKVAKNGLTLQHVINLSQRHYTIFENNTVFPVEKLIKISFNPEPEDFVRAINGKRVKVFLGQALGACIDEKDIIITEKLTKKALESLGNALYYQHPRVFVDVEGVETVQSNKCFEEEIYELLAKCEFVEVYGFYSTSLLLIKDIPGVSVHSFRTFLTTNEAKILSSYDIESTDLSLSNLAVDVVMPVYNSEKTVADAIESVLNQTYKNFRLIIVDDGSLDATEEICKKYLSDSRVNYYKILHGGISRALNTGISHATAKYIARQDSDDEWMPWHLDYLLYELEINDKLDIIGSKVIVDKAKMESGIRRREYNNLFGEKLWLDLAYRNVFNHSTVIYKKSAYEKAGKYDSQCDGFEDWHLWARMVTKDNALVVNTVTSYYRVVDKKARGMIFRSRLAKSRGLRLDDVLE